MSKLTRLSVSLSHDAVSKARRIARDQRTSVSRLLSVALERCILTQPDEELAQPLATIARDGVSIAQPRVTLQQTGTKEHQNVPLYSKPTQPGVSITQPLATIARDGVSPAKKEWTQEEIAARDAAWIKADNLIPRDQGYRRPDVFGDMCGECTRMLSDCRCKPWRPNLLAK